MLPAIKVAIAIKVVLMSLIPLLIEYSYASLGLLSKKGIAMILLNNKVSIVFIVIMENMLIGVKSKI